MTHAYMASHDPGAAGVQYSAMTLASPGYYGLDIDYRTSNFINEDDPIRGASIGSALAKLAINELLGVDIGTQLYFWKPGDDYSFLFGDFNHIWSPDISALTAQHNKGLYGAVLNYVGAEFGETGLPALALQYNALCCQLLLVVRLPLITWDLADLFTTVHRPIPWSALAVVMLSLLVERRMCWSA